MHVKMSCMMLRQVSMPSRQCSPIIDSSTRIYRRSRAVIEPPRPGETPTTLVADHAETLFKIRPRDYSGRCLRLREGASQLFGNSSVYVKSSFDAAELAATKPWNSCHGYIFRFLLVKKVFTTKVRHVIAASRVGPRTYSLQRRFDCACSRRLMYNHQKSAVANQT